MKSLLPNDEINLLVSNLTHFDSPSKPTKKHFIDSVLELLILDYVYGVQASNEMLNTDIKLDINELQETVYKKIEGKDFADRIGEYYETENASGIQKVIETESHRVYNEAAYKTAVKGGATHKEWICQFINSRETHEYLHGTKIPLDAEFYTFMGNKTMFPGEFGVAEEDCNCRCELAYSKEGE